MKLHNANHSPYASRCRIQIYAKDIAVDIIDPPGGMGSAEAKSLTPIGKVPSLDTGDAILPESRVIMEFLEDSFPDKPLRPDSPIDRAWMNAIISHSDLYLAPALFALFGQLKTQTCSDEEMSALIEKLRAELAVLDELLEKSGFNTDKPLDLSDITSAPSIFYIISLLPVFGDDRGIDDFKRVSQWWEWAVAQAPVKRVVDEMDIGIKGFLKALGRL